MPDAPDVSLFTRYVLENPWPAFAILLAVGAGLIWSGMREGLLNRVKAGGALAAVAACVLLGGVFVVTSGERARAVTRSMVQAAAGGDAVGAIAYFAPEAAFTVGSPLNPGLDFDFIQNQLIRLTERYKIDSNSITMLRGFSESSDSAVVHVACFTEVNGFPYPTVSRWVVRVRKQSDGEWKIVHLTCVAINDQTPPLDGLR